MLPKLFHSCSVLLATGFLVSITCLSACKKDKDAVAEVVVLDATQLPVTGALVVVFADSTLKSINGFPTDVDKQSQVTGSDGKATFTYHREMVLSLLVEKDGIRVNDVVHFEINDKTTKTVTLK